LLPYEISVKNDYELGVTTKAHIVTGSNMAGKSTFIRTVGLNLVLAMNGLPVCAREFSCSVMSIASCIRITDSLEENASYFRAELIRLEHIVKLIGSGEPYIVLLDEILRGTNSDDKRMGTLAFFRKLKDYNCLAILATHDLVIGKLEEEYPQHFSNYCFESELRGAELHFDYKLRKGVSSSTNATFLMKSLGLID
ncbi:MAG TPA: DNA mismatch repair protein MutS, partial [Cyclobacteriaceae bacterium]|nr:DNA mismatch repair protein MutS [Cyclobacteriaceae bacterium]